MLCVAPQDWPKLISAFRAFGQANDLKLIGGVDENPDGKPMLNVALAQGYNYYFGDDLDLWVTSDPFRPNVIDYAAVGRYNPITPAQWRLARGGLKAILPVTSFAGGTRQEPKCG
jgi:hypothetical protein